MKDIHLTYIPKASLIVLHDFKLLGLFLLLTSVFFWLLIYIPVWRIPGNDLRFQLSILSDYDFGLLGTLSAFTSLSLVMNWYLLIRQFRANTGLIAVGQMSLGGLAGITASIFGTVSCAACVASLFGFLGFSGVLFLLQYRQAMTIGAIVLLVVSLYFTSQKVLGVCEICKVDYRRKKKS